MNVTDPKSLRSEKRFPKVPIRRKKLPIQHLSDPKVFFLGNLIVGLTIKVHNWLKYLDKIKILYHLKHVFFNIQIKDYSISVADLHSKILDAPPPRGPNSFNFMQFLGNFWQNRMLVPPLGSWRPHLGEILDPPLHLK